MERSLRHWTVVVVAAALLGPGLTGCNYAPSGPPPVPTGTLNQPVAEGRGSAASSTGLGPQTDPGVVGGDEQKTAIMTNVVKLIQGAAMNPGGDNFRNAIKNLNQYFAGTPEPQYTLPPASRAFLEGEMPRGRVDELEQTTWAMPDARHVEDCMLYHGIASRVAGTGDDLTRVRRVFDWMVGQVQLVPAGSLAAPRLGQAYARPFDVLLRGMATEAEGVWSERGWLFLSLCRQLGLDGGLITYTPPGGKAPVVWCVAILVDDTPYLFDTRLGLAVPDAKGDGVATLAEALTDPAVLARMDLPGQLAYGTTRDALASSPSKIGVLLDSSPRYFSPRMKLLQRSLAGKDLSVLYRDPAVQRDHWARALGGRLGAVKLWELPMRVETLLFTDPQFVQATQAALFMFHPRFPLMFARMKQLRGETTEAVRDYVAFRFAENATETDGRTPMNPEFQKALDVYATYFLGTCHLEQKDARQAEFFFDRTLKMLPDWGPRQPYYNMFRWGAQANLARLREAKGDPSRAVAYYSQGDPTTQGHGNLLRARELVWRDPTAPVPDPLPPPPPPTNPAVQAAATAAPPAVK